MSTPTPPEQKQKSNNALLLLITRLHFYIGLFVGPFIFIAALTGTLYVLTPQLANIIYQDVLTTESQGPEQPLAAQIQAAQASLPHELKLFAVRPAPSPGETTRIMFLDPASKLSGASAVFVDPVTLQITGHLPVYGTSGILPLRMNLDFLHRQLLQGEWGRYYSELAASWMWIAALGGLYLWWRGGKKNKAEFAARTPHLRHRRRHVQIGLVIFLGLVFFSATGLTWSKWAGGNIAQLRAQIGWVTPSVSLNLETQAPKATAHDPHAAHHDAGNIQSSTETHPLWTPQQFDQVLATARAAGIDAGKLEIKPPKSADKAWFVREIDRSWPTQVDSVAIDPNQMKVISRADFAEFPLIAKLIRWGIDAHMGILFGWPNQLMLAAFGITLCVMIILGYRMWWLRRPAAGPTAKPLLQAWAKLSNTHKSISVMLALFLGWSLPVLGVSLIIFLMIDALRWRAASDTAQN
ncbi:hypothetical protein BFW38_02635 [Terasakiispira papahanaumokuakeensis]|uniref:PepSY domain-containing protein n=1 Tax=Terasakiispira papahanaumokuakeensis TaxID=197479 RepID=A0A1E2V6I7_9GAMM|nr:PepSY-associated TM helix domain-containing protein [Terasakiispira papahanaumokuakeensis]ODC02609.1 hypothetical protein BFW38_02635 [Terasakiispira papahanaumokuakeensis]